ncbi:hypothetical protein PsYK624_026070 [Phanerochaete sordida]|uniref:F-box domain-containing protein n=1 Tax=Phanerochaete sordida TaxID=48140 RepID=A0A9P3G067_9APHY|nr:hypothetical protein PsYK624_026070 [Phanerochaete sordida]
MARIRTLQQRLNDLDARAWLLERQIEEADRAAAILRSKLAENRRERAAHAAIDLSSALPDDILKLVFEEAYEHKFDDNCPICRRKLPLTVTHVSRRWRAVALSLPRLWRCIHIGTSSQSLLELSIERSWKTPLFLTLDGWDYASPGGGANRAWNHLHMRNLSYILQRTTHIARICLETNVADVLCSFMADIAGKTLPSLEHISLFAPDDENDDEALPFATISLESVELPNLKSLWLTGNIELKHAPTSFVALRTLALTECSLVPSKLAALAEAAPQLDQMYIDHCRVLEEDLEPVFAHFPAMRSLTVSRSGSQAPFSCMSLPVLASVTFVDVRFIACLPPDPDPVEAASSVLPMVRNLTLVNVGVWYDEDDDSREPYDGHMFAFIPRVTALAFRKCGAGVAPLLEHFATAVPLTLPVLEVLELTDVMGLPQDLLLRIIRHRAKHDCPLREVRLGKCMRDELGEDMVKILEDIVRVTLAECRWDSDAVF